MFSKLSDRDEFGFPVEYRSASAAGLVGENNPNTVLLCHFDVDVSDATGRHSPAAQSSAAVSDAQAKFGAKSLFLNGTTQWAKIANNADFNFSNGDFTVECWIRPATTASSHNILAYDTASGPVQFMIDAGKLQVYVHSGFAIQSTVQTIATNAWSHLAFLRKDNTWRAALNGTIVQTSTSSVTIGNPNSINGISIGCEVTGISQFFSGYIDEYRILKGESRWVDDFTPPLFAYKP